MTLPSAQPIRHREMLLAQQVASKLSSLLASRHMLPAFSAFYVFHSLNMTFLVAVLDSTRIGDHGRYIDQDFLHQVSTDLKGLPVYLSNSTGIRYMILLSKLPMLPKRVDLPADTPPGKLAIGLRVYNLTPVLVDWETTHHIAVLGATGSGKSAFLQSMVIQAVRNDMKLMLSDLDQTSFPAFENHPALLSPIATTPAGTLQLVEQAIAECDLRAKHFKELPEHPQKISEYNALARKHSTETLPHILIILDEISAVLAAAGGAKGALGQALAALSWRGRKFGVHLIFGAQEFTKDLLGPMRQQVSLVVCFRVESAQMAANMGCQGAEGIKENRPGLAITNRFGPVQTYFVEPAAFPPHALLPAVSNSEHELFMRAIRETDGRLSIPILTSWGLRERAARHLLENWEVRGWVLRDPQHDNARYITPKLREILPNRQTGQAASSPG